MEPNDPLTVTFDKGIVTLDALERAAYALAASMSIDIRNTPNDYVCTLFPSSQVFDGLDLAHRLRREVLDQTLRLRIGKETEPVRNLIFALAFSQTGLLPDEPAT